MLNSMKQGLDKCWTAVRSACNLKLNKEKCHFCISEVCYVGHVLSSDGIKPEPQKVEAVNFFADSSQSWRLTEVLNGSYNLPVKVHSKHVPEKRSFVSAAPERFWMVLIGKRLQVKQLEALRQPSHLPQSLSSLTPRNQRLCGCKLQRFAILQSNHHVAKYASKTLSLS